MVQKAQKFRIDQKEVQQGYDTDKSFTEIVWPHWRGKVIILKWVKRVTVAATGIKATL